MADIKKSSEIVTEQDLKSVLESKTFDSKAFLELYNIWKVTKDASTFATLRSMHENAGYNNKNIFFGAEQEMHEIAAIVQKYHVDRGAIVAGTAEAVSGTPRPMNIILSKSIPFFDNNGNLVQGNGLQIGQVITLPSPIVERDKWISGQRIPLTQVIVNNQRIWVKKIDIDTNMAANSTPWPQKQEISPQGALDAITAKKSELDSSLETMTLENLEKSLKTTESIVALAPDSHTALARGLAGKMILGRLQELGYGISISRDKKVVVTSINKDAKDVENKINTFLAIPNAPMLDILRIGVLYMSPTFQQYSESKSIDGKISSPQKPEEYKRYLDAKNKTHGSLSSADKVFIDSYNKGGYTGYELTPAMMQSKYLEKVVAFAENPNPATATAIQVAPPTLPATTTSPSSLPVAPTGSTPIAPTYTPTTTAGKAAGAVGGAVGTVAGGIGSLVGTVASETGSTWSTILSEATKTGGTLGAVGVIGLIIGSIWKFGFWKTMMGVVGVGGASAIANAAENGTFTKLADKVQEGAKKVETAVAPVASTVAPAVTPETAPTLATGVTNAPLSEQEAEKKVFADTVLIGLINDKKNSIKNAKPQAYIDFVRSIKDTTDLKTLISPNDDPKNGIFGTGGWDATFAQKIPNTLDSTLLKDVMRLYLTGESIRRSALKPDGSTWETYKSKFDLTKPLSEEIKKTYLQGNVAPGAVTTTIDENHIRAFTITGIIPTQVNITINPDGTSIGQYSLPKIGNFEPNQPLSISYDANGNVMTPSIVITGKDGALGTARKTATVKKTEKGIDIQIS